MFNIRFGQAASLRRLLLVIGISIALADSGRALPMEEDFSSDPKVRGWRVAGDADLFRWNAAEGTVEVTWDSSRSNSFFHLPMAAPLTKADDFSFAFDLVLHEVAVGTTPERKFSFQLAAGFVNLADGVRTNFLRGTGINPTNGPMNVVEFNYFPDSGFGATVSPTILSSNNQFAAGFEFPLELNTGARFRVQMSYTAADETLRTILTRDGAAFGPVKDVKLPPDFTDFKVDSLAISSYSDEGADGSIRARGTVDNIVWDTPPPPIGILLGGVSNGAWQTTFASLTNWVYMLEASSNLVAWNEVASAPGNGRMLSLADENSPAGNPVLQQALRLYRVRAERK